MLYDRIQTVSSSLLFSHDHNTERRHDEIFLRRRRHLHNNTKRISSPQRRQNKPIMETFKNNEQIKSYFENAYAFAVFPHCAKAGFAVGAAGGSGDVYINNKDGTETKVGTSLMRQVSVGFQLGGQIYSEILFFETETDFERFKDGNFEFGAEASAVALTASASAKVTTMGNQGVTSGITAGKAHLDNAGGYAKGAAVFTVALGGLMYQATIAGQKFSFKPIDA